MAARQAGETIECAYCETVTRHHAEFGGLAMTPWDAPPDGAPRHYRVCLLCAHDVLLTDWMRKKLEREPKHVDHRGEPVKHQETTDAEA